MITIHVEVSELEDYIRKVEDVERAMQDFGPVFKDAVDKTVLPRVIENSRSVWQVRTGKYSGSWATRQMAPNSVEIYNPVGYSDPLEFGWTRGRFTIPSPGVLIPAIMDALPDLEMVLRDWMEMKLQE